MIKLMIEDYCQDCKNFEVHQKSSTFFTDDNAVFSDHILTCKHAELCRRLKKHLERSIKEVEV